MIKLCKNCGKEFTTNRSARDYCGYSCSNQVTARNRERNKISGELTTVWSCGGGVESTAIAALIYSGVLPKPDIALMTDCGYERKSTWDHVYGTLKPKLAEVGVDLKIVKTTDYSNSNIFDGDHLLLPAYSNAGGKRVKFHTHCNSDWKLRVAKRFLREQGVKNCQNWVGISLDEIRRARGGSAKRWFAIRYPLIEQSMTREDCLWYIGHIGWPRPPKTSCYFCPQQTDSEWLKMKNTAPDEWDKAVELDEYIRTIKPDTYLHRTLKPLRELEG